jgi:hypothetical protein
MEHGALMHDTHSLFLRQKSHAMTDLTIYTQDADEHRIKNILADSDEMEEDEVNRMECLTLGTPAPRTTGELRMQLDQLDWLICICPVTQPCFCGLPLVPEAAVDCQIMKASSIPGAHCLSVAECRVHSPNFELGLRCGLRDNAYPMKNREADATWEGFTLAAMEAFTTPPSEFTYMRTLEKALQARWPDGNPPARVVTGVMAGFVCASVHVKITEMWDMLSSFLDGNCPQSAEDESLVVGGMVNAVITNVHLLENAHIWRSSLEENEYELCRSVLEGGRYWYVQHVLFLVHSYSLIKTEGWSFANQIYKDGGMPWQVGWFQLSSSAVRCITKIISTK